MPTDNKAVNQPASDKGDCVNQEQPHETEAARQIEQLINGRHFNQSTVDRLKWQLDLHAIITRPRQIRALLPDL